MTTVVSMSAAPQQPSQQPSQQVPGFELGAELGRGGAGVVYAARRLADGAEVAVKVLHGRPGPGRLEAEARRASRVRHPGVLPVLEAGSSADAVWLVMPRVGGSDLQVVLDAEGARSPAEAVDLLTQISRAVAAVHAVGLVHCDLKPANVLLEPGAGGSGPRVLVSDFGIAARRPADPGSSDGEALFTAQSLTGDLAWSRSATGAAAELTPRAAGTYGYMAPEQWRGEPPTPLSDVYSLGATLYAVLTGRRPFEQRSLPELAYAVAVAPAPRPSDSGAPAGFDAVVARAMAKDPAERYPSAVAFAEALTGASGEPRSGGERAGRRLTSSRLWVGVGVLVVIAGLLLAWNLHEPQRAPVAHTATTAATAARVVCARDLSLRDRPGGGGVTAQQLKRGDHVTVDRTRDQGAYSFVTTAGGRSGWVLNGFLRDRCAPGGVTTP